MNELEKLKEMVNKDGFDKDSREYVRHLEEQLNQAVMGEDLKNHPVLNSYHEFLLKEIVDCKEMLSDERERLDDKQRDRLFERIRQCKRALMLFGSNKAEIESKIKELFEKAVAL